MENDIIKYSIEEIAEKILADSKYESELKNGIEQKIVVDKTYTYFVIDSLMNQIVEKEDLIGWLTYFNPEGSYSSNNKYIRATIAGYFCRNNDIEWNKNYYIRLENFFNKSTIVVGKIYLPEFKFYEKNKKAIDEYVKNKKLQIEEQLKLAEIKKQEMEEEERRKAEKQLKEQKDAIEDIAELLKELDKYVLAKQTIEIETLQEISSALQILYNQDDIQNIVSIENSASHFESTYKEAKKNPNLTDIIENRMLTILRTFYDIIDDFYYIDIEGVTDEDDEDSVEVRLAKIKAAGDDIKFQVDFNAKKEALDETVKKLQEKFSKEKELDFAQLKPIENLAGYFLSQKDKIKQTQSLEASKDILEFIWKEYSKQDDKSSVAEENLKRILKSFYALFGKSELEINDIFTKQKSEEADRKFEIEFNDKVKNLDEAVTKLQSKFTNENKLDFEQLKTIENLASFFSSQKDRIKQKNSLEPNKDILESIWKEYSKQDDKSSSAEENLKRILKSFYTILWKSEQEISDIFTKQENEENIRKLSSQIQELEILVEYHEQVKIEILQTIEDLLNKLSMQNMIQDKSEILNGKIHFDAIFKDCKKKKGFSNSSKLRMQEISNKFSEVLGIIEKKGFFAKVFGK